jgi:GTP diphosphokinase / guanosine-3',5'-bis(diphosphate) 3'-diphosphatase
MLSTFYKNKLDELILACKRNITSNNINVDLISKAFRFALDAHKNDKRASGEPYFSHPYEVALTIAKEIPLDDISVAAALLHDVIEDTKFTVNDLKEEFGNEIAEIVDGATKIEGIFDNYELQQIESYKKLLLSMTSDMRVMVVKFADRLHNLRTLEFLPENKKLRLAQETLDIYAPFAHRFGLANVKSEMEDLSFKCLNRQKYDDIAKKLKETKKDREKLIKKFIEPIKEKLTEAKYKFEIVGRAKSIYSINRKLNTRVKSFEDIFDLIAIRIILDTPNKNDCFSVYGICSQLYLPVPERFKDFISRAKQNGYQSLHTTLVSKEGKMVEVQIRTKEMHEVAEKGIAAHWKYKENTNITDKNLEFWMKWIRETFENAGKDDETSRQLIESFKLNLFQDEIYCFTPKGELKILPSNATPVDFAFEIHSEVGMKCIGAKVNGKIVNLDTKLKSGDQVEIITSKTQKPKQDWIKFVVTQKARADIKKFFNIENRKTAALGKELFEKKIKKNRIHFEEESLLKVIHKFKYKDLNNFFFEAGKDENVLKEVLEILSDKSKLQQIDSQTISDEKEAENISEFNKFISDAQNKSGTISIGGEQNQQKISNLKYEYAKCCNPIPGDDVIGFVTLNEGIKIHRRICKNILHLYLQEPNRIMEIGWGDTEKGIFTGGIKFIGEDRPGFLKDITTAISKNFNVNIRSINMYTKGAMFEGTMIIEINSLNQLNIIIEKLKSLPGVISASRYDD